MSYDPLSVTSREQLERVQSLTDAALAHLTLEGLLDELLIRVRDMLHVDTAAVLLLDDERKELIATAAKGIEEEVEQGIRIPVGAGFAGSIAATAKPVILPVVDHTKVLNPLLLRRGIRSMLGVPLIVSGSVVGVMHVGTLREHEFTQADVGLLQLVADRAALALDARRHHQARVIAETLQRSLLPDRLPRVEGVEISSLYVPAGGGTVGGDWYDVFALPSGALCVVVGDTVGSGIDAAIAMARMRDAMRALMFVDAAPHRAMTHLNALMMHFDPGMMATAFIGVLDAEGALSYALAGHVPPIVIDGTRKASLLDGAPEPALGSTFHTYEERAGAVPTGSTLLVYTDGLVERRGRPLEEGLEALRSVAEREWPSVEAMCAAALETDVLRSVLRDDLAVVAIRVSDAVTSSDIRMTINADPRELATLRQALRRWLTEKQVGKHDAADILLAIGEATANSVEHAYGPGRGSVRVHVGLRKDEVVATVADDGRWRDPRGTDRGRGRLLMRAVMDHAAFETNDRGTTVRMRKVLSRRDD